MADTKDKRLRAKIRKQWNIDSFVSDLCDATWRKTEPRRYDRMIGVGTYQGIERMAKGVFSAKDWKDAAKDGFEQELVEEYMEILANLVSQGSCEGAAVPPGIKEWRPSPQEPRPIGHVYATSEDGDVFLGQYEDATADELREMGYTNIEE
jgi:hypothetical protein